MCLPQLLPQPQPTTQHFSINYQNFAETAAQLCQFFEEYIANVRQAHQGAALLIEGTHPNFETDVYLVPNSPFQSQLFFEPLFQLVAHQIATQGSSNIWFGAITISITAIYTTRIQ